MSAALSVALPDKADGSIVFAEPWEARAFAIIVTMSQSGHFSWSEWAECFAKEIAAATAAEAAGGRPKTYYEQWLRAAETLMIDKGVTTREQLIARRFAAGAAGSAHVIG